MTSLGQLKENFRAQKKQANQQRADKALDQFVSLNSHYDLVIMGEGPMSAAFFHLLRHTPKHSFQSILWLNPNGVLRPMFFRGENNREAMELLAREFNLQMDPPVAGDLTGHSAFFMKDGELNLFGGRKKPFPLMPGEELFLKPSLAVDGLFGAPAPEELAQMGVTSFQHEILGLNLDQSPQSQWTIDFGNGRTCAAKKILWCGPYRSLGKLLPKEIQAKYLPQIPAESSELYLSYSFELPAGVKLVNGDVLDASYFNRAIFLPQSQTHEWGHFICEFRDAPMAANKSVKGECFFLIPEDQESAESVSSKIKLMKRQLEKLVPGMEKVLGSEQLSFFDQQKIMGQEIPFLKIEGLEFPQLAQDDDGIDRPTLNETDGPMRSLLAVGRFLMREGRPENQDKMGPSFT